jgi:Macrocin-O-methyltransferase (TylF)
MPIWTQLKRAALLMPPLRRLYEHSLQQASEVDRLNAERESSEIRLYELRSAHQRSVSRNDELAAKLAMVEQRLAQAQLHVKPADLELVYAKLAAQITRSSADIGGRLSQALLQHSDKANSVNATRYLDLLESTLTGQLFADEPISPWSNGYNPEIRAIGRDWPSRALTMIGTTRMRNVRVLLERAIEDSVPGDVLEAGVWRGGACVYMRGIIAAWNVSDRRVWVADSFVGLPPPDPDQYPADSHDIHHTYKELVVSLEEVRANFALFGLLDDQVCFLKGWFSDTLPTAPIDRLAVLRLDGDMYSSTMQTLTALYDKVSPGGWVIVDDYILDGCRQAVTDFRERRNITDEMEAIDGAAVYWRKQ